jgi:hypothetical protein
VRPEIRRLLFGKGEQSIYRTCNSLAIQSQGVHSDRGKGQTRDNKQYRIKYIQNMSEFFASIKIPFFSISP